MSRIEMNQLAGFVVLAGVPATSDVNDKIISDVIGAGPITKQPGTKAFRVVLRATEREFVVHEQYFPNFVSGENLSEFDGSYFEQGDYYPAGELVTATQRFAERLIGRSYSIASIYRDIERSSDIENRLQAWESRQS